MRTDTALAHPLRLCRLYPIHLPFILFSILSSIFLWYTTTAELINTVYRWHRKKFTETNSLVGKSERDLFGRVGASSFVS